MVYRHTNDAYPLWETFEPLRHFQVDENAGRITMTVTCLGRKASLKMIESAALVELSGALAATNRYFEAPFARSPARSSSSPKSWLLDQLEPRTRKVISMPS